MKAVKELVGSCIHFDEARYNNNVRQLMQVAVNANLVIAAYMQLPHEKRPLNKKFLVALQNEGVSTIEKEYVAFGESEIVRGKVVIKAMQTQIREGIYADLKPVNEAWKKLEAGRELQRQSAMENYDLSLDFLDFKNGRVVLSDEGQEELKLEYCVFIDNEEQAEIWQSYLDFQTMFNTHVDRLRNIGYPMHPNLQPLISGRSMMYEGEGNYLEIHADWFSFIKSLMAKKPVMAIA